MSRSAGHSRYSGDRPGRGGWRPGRQNCVWTCSRGGVDDRVDRRRGRNGCNERRAWHVAAHRIAPVLPVGFCSHKEERLIADDGATQRSAKLIQTKRLLLFAVGGPLRYRGIKNVVAQILKQAPVKTVCARRRGDGQLRVRRLRLPQQRPSANRHGTPEIPSSGMASRTHGRCV